MKAKWIKKTIHLRDHVRDNGSVFRAHDQALQIAAIINKGASEDLTLQRADYARGQVKVFASVFNAGDSSSVSVHTRIPD